MRGSSQARNRFERIVPFLAVGALVSATLAAAAESAGHGPGESAHGLRHALTEAPLLVAFALVLGMVCQVVARHLRLPGIVVLLAVGVLVGPDVGALIDPADLGNGLQTLVGFAVAIILFEGGVNLNWRQLRRQGRAIRGLVTVGALVTTVGGTLAAHWILGWEWRLSILFGTLVIVTGPTVINPLLRRIRVEHRLATVLEAEGVFGDAIGAAVAVVALEIALAPSRESFALGLVDFFTRFAIGGALGIAGGFLLLGLLRLGWAVPEGLENVFTLAYIVFLFQFSNALSHESGILCVTVAGVAVGNLKSDALSHLREFKEQLTVLLIGMLFVLLAADVRMQDVQALGRPGVITVLVLMLVVRPINVLASTVGTDLGWRDKAFLSWLAPRGIVAAAVSSLFALSLDQAGIAGGRDLRALVFLVIAVTVLVQGLSGGLVASLLGVRPPPARGVVILGAQALARRLADALRDRGRPVTFIDANPQHCQRAEEAGFRVLYGSGFDENLLQRARLGDVEWALAMTPNSEVNLNFALRMQREFGIASSWVALDKASGALTPNAVERAGPRLLFGEPRSLSFWNLKSERQAADLETWRCDDPSLHDWTSLVDQHGYRAFLPLLVARKGKLAGPVDELRQPTAGEEWTFLVVEEHRDDLSRSLGASGWQRVAVED